MIKESIRKVVQFKNLTEGEMEKSMLEVMAGGATPSQIGTFLTGLRMKGETVDEITGAAKALRSKVLRLHVNNHVLNLDRDDINVEEETILDTCDTGENGTHTFNVSTATALVVAGGGIKVAKHGSRATSEYLGISDVLENLGVNLDLSSSEVEACIKGVGIGFLFGPLFNGPMRDLVSLRKEMAIRTLFNLIGPLANPAGAKTHILGVYRPALTEKMAQVLMNLGAKEAFVVCGEETLDEISICGETRISHLREGHIETFTMAPEDYGFRRATPEAIRGGSASENAQIIRAVLGGAPGPKRDLVLLNSGAAFVSAGLDADFRGGIQRAKEVIDSGRALEKLEDLIQYTRHCKPYVRKELSFGSYSI
jgi:anthranilate phosphoribosyltransferase